jgi:ParB-like chromosome segregation protein Spo0J
MGLKELVVGKSELFRMDPRTLNEEEGWNVRTPSAELTAHIRRLADSIKEIGVQVPLKVRLDELEVPYVVSGHCRLAAAMMAIGEGAEIKSVPVIIEEGSEGDRVLSMVVGNDGKPLTILEQGAVYRRLVLWGWELGEVAKKSGYSGTHIGSCLALDAALPAIKSLVQEGKVSATLAIKLINEVGEKEALAQMLGAVKVAEEAGKKRATKKDAEKVGLPKEVKAARADWKKWGPRLFKVVESLVECPASGKGSERMGDYLAAANALIQEMEDAGVKGGEV